MAKCPTCGFFVSKPDSAKGAWSHCLKCGWSDHSIEAADWSPAPTEPVDGRPLAFARGRPKLRDITIEIIK